MTSIVGTRPKQPLARSRAHVVPRIRMSDGKEHGLEKERERPKGFMDFFSGIWEDMHDRRARMCGLYLPFHVNRVDGSLDDQMRDVEMVKHLLFHCAGRLVNNFRDRRKDNKYLFFIGYSRSKSVSWTNIGSWKYRQSTMTSNKSDQILFRDIFTRTKINSTKRDREREKEKKQPKSFAKLSST